MQQFAVTPGIKEAIFSQSEKSLNNFINYQFFININYLVFLNIFANNPN
jgi:hypothetical protein